MHRGEDTGRDILLCHCLPENDKSWSNDEKEKRILNLKDANLL